MRHWLTTLGLAAALCAGLAAAAGAQTPARERLAEAGEDIPLAEWREMVEGRTVWYRIGEALWGRERYRGDGTVTFQFPDGECLEAAWFHDPPWYCFDFGGALGGGPPHCFRHLRLDGELWALGLSGGAPQRIERIDSAPLACGPSPSVRLPRAPGREAG
jgi:hypothetical protein